LENHFSKQPDREKKDQSNVPPPAQDELAPPITLGVKIIIYFDRFVVDIHLGKLFSQDY
jgi:hypothetical protein